MFLAANPPSFNFNSNPPGFNSCSYGSINLPDLLIFAHNRNPRPCLVDSASSPAQRGAKRVVFADDKGLPLTQVRVMREPSTCPPRWTKEYLDRVAGFKSQIQIPANQEDPVPWEAKFQQPVSDYVDFRSRLDALNVSLENLLVCNKDHIVKGTVKVKNLSFSKAIKARVTFDEWKTFEDVNAVHVPTGSFNTATGSVNLYDTFSFNVKIPNEDNNLQRIELCVCYICDHGEFWDNNLGKNYVFVKPQVQRKKAKDLSREVIVKEFKCNDALTAKCDNWTEFASWNHLSSDGPYW